MAFYNKILKYLMRIVDRLKLQSDKDIFLQNKNN